MSNRTKIDSNKLLMGLGSFFNSDVQRPAFCLGLSFTSEDHKVVVTPVLQEIMIVDNGNTTFAALESEQDFNAVESVVIGTDFVVEVYKFLTDRIPFALLSDFGDKVDIADQILTQIMDYYEAVKDSSDNLALLIELTEEDENERVLSIGIGFYLDHTAADGSHCRFFDLVANHQYTHRAPYKEEAEEGNITGEDEGGAIDSIEKLLGI